MLKEGRGDHWLSAGAGALEVLEDLAVGAIRLGGKTVALPYARTVFGIEGMDCDAVCGRGAEGITASLTARRWTGAASILPSPEEMRIRIRADAAPAPDPPARVSVSLSMPPETRFHLAEFPNVGRRIDGSMPVGESLACGLHYNFVVMELDGLCLRVRVDDADARRLQVEIQRHPDSFTVTFSWAGREDLAIAVHATVREATEALEGILRRRHGIRTAAERFPGAGWLAGVRLVLTADMMRSDGRISHDYADVTRLAGDLSRIGCPADTVLYLPGWNGPYDSGGPTYGPCGALGGEAGFRAMADAIHGCGFRLMIHATGWGIDPYHPRIDEMEPWAVRDADGERKGWQINGKWSPPCRSLRFRTGPLPFPPGPEPGDGLLARIAWTPPAPDLCEALFTVGGLRGFAGRITVSCGLRLVRTPPGWFHNHDSYDLPYPFALQAGRNRLRFEADSAADWRGAWFRIRHAFGPPGPYAAWTWPILMADPSRPEYAARFTGSIARCVRDFRVDMVHVDATSFHEPPSSEKLLRALQEALGDTPLSGEWTSRIEEIGFWCMAQEAVQSLAPSAQEAPREPHSLPIRCLGGATRWRERESGVCDFAAAYTRCYPHLIAANSFVPVGKVSHIGPARRLPPRGEDLRRELHEARRLRYIPGLRVNYRDHGLDPETVRAIRKVARWTRKDDS